MTTDRTEIAAPLVTVVVPAYNVEDHIEETLNSIASQQFSDFEVVVVDDGSSDDTGEIVKSFKDPRVRYIYQEHSTGPARPRNRGIAEARGELIALFDADDIMLPGKLHRSVTLLQACPQAGLVFTDFDVIDEPGAVIRSEFLKPYTTLHSIPYQPVCGNGRLLSSSQAFQGLIFANFVGTSGVLARKSVLLEAGGFFEAVRNADDKLMWLRIALNHDLIFLPEVHHYYRQVEGGITSRTPSRKTEGLATVFKAIEKLPLSKDCRGEVQRQKMKLWFEDGMCHFNRYDLALARKSFWESFRIRNNFQAGRFLIFCCLGERNIRLLRKFKAFMESHVLNKTNEGKNG